MLKEWIGWSRTILQKKVCKGHLKIIRKNWFKTRNRGDRMNSTLLKQKAVLEALGELVKNTAEHYEEDE